jgi:hypothetical protein
MQMTQPKIQGLKFKSGINLYTGEQAGQFLIGTMRSRLAINSPLAPEIYSALQRGLTRSELEAVLAVSAADLDELLAQLHSYEFLETQSSAIQISQRFISNIAERAAKGSDRSKDASYAQMKNRISPELTLTRWLPGVCDSGVATVSARQSAHLEISGNSRAAQHLFSALVASGLTHTQFAPSFRRGREQVCDADISGGYISAVDYGQIFKALSEEKAKSIALFPQSSEECAEELPIGFSEKVIKIHFGEIDPAILALWMSAGQEHLLVSEISGGYLTITPLIRPGITPCSRCCELTIADQSRATLLENTSPKDELPIVGANYLASILAAQLLQLIDTGICTLSTEAISIDLLDLCNTKHIAITRHPMCGCSW